MEKANEKICPILSNSLGDRYCLGESCQWWVAFKTQKMTKCTTEEERGVTKYFLNGTEVSLVNDGNCALVYLVEKIVKDKKYGN